MYKRQQNDKVIGFQAVVFSSIKIHIFMYVHASIDIFILFKNHVFLSSYCGLERTNYLTLSVS